ncbi:MAG: response regulator transcription factor [Verrucomicrobia bacterium]|nr:response regulator transcription factor [Cytophagales bacterium]
MPESLFPVSCIIVEDNRIERTYLQSQVEKCPFLTLKGSFSNPIEAISFLSEQSVGLLLLDIDMPLMSGIDFLKSLENPPLCIFITSHAEYAWESYEVHAFDFILKPLQADRFEKTMLRLKEYIETRHKARLYEVQFENDFISIKEGFDVIQLRVSEIIYLEALQNYTKIVTPTHKYLTLYNLKNFIERLPEEKFLRIHRSYAVAKNKIRKFIDNELILETVTLPVGKTFRQDVNKILSG